MGSKQLADGRWEHWFHQSWLSTYAECPEMARTEMLKMYPREETDANCKGTAVHAAIEAVLVRNADFADALNVGMDLFRELAATEGFKWVKVKTEKTALEHVAGGFASWYHYVWPTLGASKWVEEHFSLTLHEDDERVIGLAGTVDYAELPSGIRDWKLTSNTDKYKSGFGGEGWKQTRWAIQPTAYAAAAYDRGLYAKTETVPFTFVALSPMGREPQLCPAPRTWDHVQWLLHQLTPIAKLIEANLSQWPLRDQHALCSPDWCPHWDACKGQFLPHPKHKQRNNVHAIK